MRRLPFHPAVGNGIAEPEQALAEHLIGDVRDRMSREGVSGLSREEVGEPVGNSLNHNLIQELMLSMTLVPRDLTLIDEPE